MVLEACPWFGAGAGSGNPFRNIQSPLSVFLELCPKAEQVLHYVTGVSHLSHRDLSAGSSLD